MAGTQALSLVSALLFFVGLAPAAWLIQIWRRPDQLAFHGLSGLDPAELADIAEAEGALGYLCKDRDPARLLGGLGRILVGTGSSEADRADVHVRT